MKSTRPTRRLRFALMATALSLAAVLGGCNSSSNSGSSKTGQFAGIPVKGLSYRTPSGSGTTDAQSTFHYRSGEQITFSNCCKPWITIGTSTTASKSLRRLPRSFPTTRIP